MSANNLKPGDKAPAFTLKSSDLKDISLQDYNGRKLVILFFPFAYTSVCTNELCSMRDSLAEYEQMNAEVIGISVDSPFTLAKFKEDQQLNFPLLSDFNKEISKSYHAYYEEFVLGLKGVSKRSAFVVDKDGIIQYAEVLENAGELPNFAAIKEVVNSLK